MKKVTNSFIGTAIFTTIVVGVLSLGVWFARAFVIRYLSSEHTIAGVNIKPYGYKMEGLLTHSYDSVFVSKEGLTVRIEHPQIKASIFGANKNVALKTETIDIQMTETSGPVTSQEKKEIPDISISDDVRIPIPVKLNVNKASITLPDGKRWSLNNLEVENTKEKAVSLKAENVRGDFIESPAEINLTADFSQENLKADIKVKTAKDNLSLKMDAPKNDLTQIKTSTNLKVKDPESWIPAKIPDALPNIGPLDVSADAKVSLKTGKINYKAHVKTNVGALWPLMPLNVDVQLSGSQDSFKFETNLNNDEGGSIYLKGAFDMNLNGSLTGSVNHMNAEFGPQIMPLDAEIKSMEKEGDNIDVVIETRQGSIIDGTINIEDGIIASFTGDLSPYEPWALDWTRGNVVLTNNTKVNGYFDGHSLQAQAKFNGVPFAYHMKADSVQVGLNLTLEGITFHKGLIFTPDEIFDFDGEVFWGTATPHTNWSIKQHHGGNASVYISLGDSLTITAKADKANIKTIPFADIKLSEKIDGSITGQWSQNFESNMGEAQLMVDGRLDAFAMQGNILARQIGDTIYVDQAEATHNKNTVLVSGGIVLPNEANPDFTPTGFLPIQVLYANLSSSDFSIPLLLEPLNDSTLSSGMLNGHLSYKEGEGLSGSLDFFDIQFRNIDSSFFEIKKLNMFAQNEKVEINSYLDIGDGGWGGNMQIILDNIFNPNRHVSITHGSDNGGTAWVEGFIDNDLNFKGTFDVNGSWYIPGSLSEIQNTDLHVDIAADIRKGLKGITAEIRSDATQFQPPKMNMLIPLKIRGMLQDGTFSLTEASTKNELDESIKATMQFSLDSMKLMAVDIKSERYSIAMDEHKITFEGISGHLEDSEEDLFITAELPKITYSFNHDVYGEAEALAQGDIIFSIPHNEKGFIRNKSVEGNITIDKLVYHKSIDIEVTPSAIDRYITMFNNFTAKLRKKEAQEEKISTASPINLSLHISDSQRDSIMVVTPFVTFPFTIDVWVLGNTTRPLLRGDISNTNSGFIGVRDIYEFDMNSFQITWNDNPWQHGVIDVTSSQELHYCSETRENETETCPINLDIQGTITNPQAIPSSNCGTEASTAAIYYNIFLGCIADGGEESTDWNKLAGKAIGKVISATANKTLGGDYIGDIDMKVMIFDNTTTSDKDSSYFKIPVSMDRWVKNLSLIFGYTQDQSDNPTYDQALQFGINYTLPVFQDEEYSHKNHLSPSLSLNALLISKQYLTNTGTGNENRVEKNIGVNYTYKFWNPCLLGLGRCEDISAPAMKEND